MPSFQPPDIVRLHQSNNNRMPLRPNDSTAYLMVNGQPMDEVSTAENSFDETHEDMNGDTAHHAGPSSSSQQQPAGAATTTIVAFKTGEFSKPCRRWTGCEKLCLAIISVMLFFVVVLCYAALRSRCSQVEVCNTVGCVQASANILASIDTDVDPCDDFFEYACASWNREHPIPEDMAAFGTFAFVRKRVLEQVRTLLKEPCADTQNSTAIKMVKVAYSKCMDTDELRELGGRPMIEALNELGGWPLLRKEGQAANYHADRNTVTALLALARHRYASESIFSSFVYADSKNTSTNVLFLDQAQLSLGRGSKDYYLNETVFGRHMEAYKQYIYEVASLLAEDANEGWTVNRTQLDEMLEFEKELAAILVPEEERRNQSKLYNKFTMSTISELNNYIDWLQFFHSSSPPEVHSYITAETTLIVPAPDYLERLDAVLKNTSGTTLTNYIIWRVTHTFVKLLDERYDIAKQKFIKVMTGQEQMSSRWKECVNGPLSWMPHASGALYVRRHFDRKDKAEALLMIQHLRAAFVALVMKLDWMDAETKATAIKKAENMLNHIGYPDFIRDDQKLDEHHKMLNITENDTYFEVIIKIATWQQHLDMIRLTKPFDKDEFEISPAVVNAFYSPEKNAITFPAAILQPPFFKGDYPKSINYGAMGAVIGHEITHGFDDQGSQYDLNGDLKNWWGEKSMEGFTERKQCIINQYNQYIVPQINYPVNGMLTQGENIADNGGVKEAFLAYRTFIDEMGVEEPRLPGLVNFTNNQLFFLSYAQFWCGQKKAQFSLQQVLGDEHSPELFRVIGVLSNLDEFSDAFACPVGSKMNPVKSKNSKCTVW